MTLFRRRLELSCSRVVAYRWSMSRYRVNDWYQTQDVKMRRSLGGRLPKAESPRVRCTIGPERNESEVDSLKGVRVEDEAIQGVIKVSMYCTPYSYLSYDNSTLRHPHATKRGAARAGTRPTQFVTSPVRQTSRAC